MPDPLPEDRSPEPVTVKSITSDLHALGVEAGETVLVHASLSALGWVCGGAPAVVDALQRVVGEDGTLVMPTQSPGNRDPAHMEHPPVPESWYDTIREQMRPYRPDVTPTRRMGAIAECFRNYPKVQRSAHPQHSFAAWGADAAFVTEDHAYDYSFGEQSPLARIYDLHGDVLYLGTTHAKSTSLTLPEYRADIDLETETRASAVLVEGKRKWIQWEDINFDDEDYSDCGAAFDREHPNEFKTGSVGIGNAKLLDQRSLVDFGVEWLETNREWDGFPPYTTSKPGQELNLESLAEDFDGASFEPDQFPGVVSRTEDPKAASLIFWSGKIVCTGASSVDDLTTAVELTFEKLRVLGIGIPTEPDIRVQNIVTSGDLGTSLNLNAIAIGLGLEAVEYEPEQFPGLVYRFDEVDVVVLLFGSGKLVITGGSQPTDAEDAITAVHARLDDLGLLD